jgi:hypothetical protein
MELNKKAKPQEICMLAKARGIEKRRKKSFR